MFGRHLKKEYRRTMIRVYEVNSGEPIGEKYESFHDPLMQVLGVAGVLSVVAIILTDMVLPFLGICDSLPTGGLIPMIAGLIGAIFGYYGVSEPDTEET